MHWIDVVISSSAGLGAILFGKGKIRALGIVIVLCAVSSSLLRYSSPEKAKRGYRPQTNVTQARPARTR